MHAYTPVPSASKPTDSPQPSAALTMPGAAAGVIQVDVANAADAADWDAAMLRLGGGSYYHRFAWRSINEELLGQQPVYLIARTEGRIAGLLPLTFVSSRLFGRILCSVPFVNFGGPCADDPAAIHALLQRAQQVAAELGADCLELRSWRELHFGVAPSLRKISMVVPLAPDADQLFESFSPKHRRNIRRAQKNDLEIQSGGVELLPEFYAVMERAWRDLGTPFYSRDYFAGILRMLPDATRIFVCRHKGRAIATALNGCHEQTGTVEGLWNGGLPQARGLQANYVLYWEMLRYACGRGYRSFHLGRSTADSGSEDFKRKWNAVKHQMYWYYWSPDGSPAPELNVDNPKYRLAIATWRRLPLALTRSIGPRLARSIP